jgi:ABC-type transport system involved in multi-copper enzyme maturation permease subunit
VSLFKAESRRLAKRRFIRWAAVAGLLVLAAVVVGTYFTNAKATPATIAAAEVEADRSYQENVRYAQEERTRCEAAKGTPDAANYPEDCAAITPPAREDVQTEWFMPPTFDFREQFDSTWLAFAAIMALVAFVAGASFVGAEWSSGGMMNLLLWRPKRLQVLGTKLAALLTWIVALSVLVGALWTAAFWVVALNRGSTARMTSGAWQSTGLTGLRALGLVVVAAVLGFGLASLGRHTAMALGAAVGVVVVVQFAVGIVLGLAGVKFMEMWLIPTYITAWLARSYTIEDFNACDTSSFGGCQPDTMEITWQTSGLLMLAVVVIVLVPALWTMRKRDIT